MTIQDLVDYILLNGGAALGKDGNPVEVSSGYAVSLKGFEDKINLNAFTLHELEHYLKVAYKRKAYVGFWLDGGFLYVDLSIIVNDKKRAFELGRRNDQLAIYDFRKGASLYLNK